MGGYTMVSHFNSLNGQQYKKMHIYFPGNLIYVKPACTEDTQMQVRQQKKESKEEIPAMFCHRYVNWTPASPTSSRVELDTGSHFPGKGSKPPFPIAPFPSGTSGPLELWYRYDPDGFKLVQHFSPLKSCLACFAFRCCPALLLMQRSGTFSFGFPLPAARPRTVSTRRSLSTL